MIGNVGRAIARWLGRMVQNSDHGQHGGYYVHNGNFYTMEIEETKNEKK